MQSGTTGRTLALGVAVVVMSTLVGCEFLRRVRVPSELFKFKYQRVAQHSSGSGIYEVTSKQPGACGPYPLRLEDIARAVQKIGGSRGYDYLADCSEFYLVGEDAQLVRDNPLVQFGIREVGMGLQIVGGRTLISGEANEPTTMLIELSASPVVGQRTNQGYAEVSFGGAGPIYRCEGGDYPWHASIHNPAHDTFFEAEITDRDEQNTSGTFSCLARNKDDTNDTRLLIIMDGMFSMKNSLD